jgi:hypothetical protein
MLPASTRLSVGTNAERGERTISNLFVVAVLVIVFGVTPAWAQGEPGAGAPWSNYFGGNAGPTTFTPPMFGDLLGGGIQGGFGGGQFGGGQFGGGIQGGFGGGQFGGGGCGGGQFGGGGFGGGQFGGGGGFGGGQFGGQGGCGGIGGIPVFRGAFKIAENESPQPLDRLYVNYNFYSNVSSAADVHRETLGVEKTLFGGRASVGLRLPFFQVRGEQAAEETSTVGDLSLVLKYAWVNDPGTALSTGLVITMPTGPEAYSFIVKDGRAEELHPALFQPFVGYLWRRADLFVHGFGSIMVPTDSRDVTVAFLDVGLGYWIFRGGGVLAGIVPTVEAHVNIPVNHRGADDVPRFRDSVDLLAGVHFVFRDRLSVGLAVATPVTTPRLFDVEALANINYRF